ncbi:hypothetical protein [Anaerolinea sp.]|uniref:hypothetical protein n=1 Tax=Anaerolinea sp. TaxID=1872519 RepID=UPI002ACED488|nr:hypothetical protein [Anaerolinea sp.]
MKRNVISLLIIISIFAVGCSSSVKTLLPTQAVTTTPFPVVTDNPTQVIVVSTPLPQNETPLIMPQENAFTMEATATISAADFHFVIDFRKLHKIPKVPSGYTFSPVKDVVFFYVYGDQELPIDLEETGGSGGGSDEPDGTFTLHQEFDYRLKSLFPPGQEQHIIAIVTLDEALGMADPVRIELKITPK